MAFDVSWSQPALGDVEETARYIARDSPRYAGALTRRFFDAADVLIELPYIGRMVPSGRKSGTARSSLPATDSSTASRATRL